jgi:hypothetical protein
MPTSKNGRAVEAADSDWQTLEGKFFHRFCSGRRIQQQGMVQSVLPGDILVVRYFDWISGSPDWASRLVPLAVAITESWQWYRTNEQMDEAYKYSGMWDHSSQYEPCSCPSGKRLAEQRAGRDDDDDG